jgi:hypothetical protein
MPETTEPDERTLEAERAEAGRLHPHRPRKSQMQRAND